MHALTTYTHTSSTSRTVNMSGTEAERSAEVEALGQGREERPAGLRARAPASLLSWLSCMSPSGMHVEEEEEGEQVRPPDAEAEAEEAAGSEAESALPDGDDDTSEGYVDALEADAAYPYVYYLFSPPVISIKCPRSCR